MSELTVLAAPLPRDARRSEDDFFAYQGLMAPGSA
ncbi:hypothetical protein SBBP1_360007 [Burkholderiales bacterium]|nr:hypothetical protein SBBP1_360007 [Burkholderiales bacterium]